MSAEKLQAKDHLSLIAVIRRALSEDRCFSYLPLTCVEVDIPADSWCRTCQNQDAIEALEKIEESVAAAHKSPDGPGIEIGPWLPVTAKEPADFQTRLLFRAHVDGDRRAADLAPVTGSRVAGIWMLEEGGAEDRESRAYPTIGGEGESWKPTHYAEIRYVDP